MKQKRTGGSKGSRRGVTGAGGELTEAVLDEVVERVAVAVVGELVVAGGELGEALGGDGGEVAGELRVLGQDDRAAGHERVDQRLLPHGFPCPSVLPLARRLWYVRVQARRGASPPG